MSAERPIVVANADIAPSSLTLGTATINAGGTTPLELKVTNQGTATAQGIVVTISLAAGGTTSQVANVNLGSLAPYASATVAATLTAPTMSGTSAVTATVTTSSPEADTANNTAVATLEVLGSSTSTATASSQTATIVSSPPAATTTSCDYYAAPNGIGDGLSSSQPFRVSGFWALAAPGKTLCLLDGTYQGAAGMISPGTAAAGVSGTSASPITIKALNEGGVLIDGQGARLPLYLNGNQWWIIEGVNVANSSGDVVAVYGSHNNILRRICAWNAGGGNNHVWQLWNANYNTFEDVCGFGNGRTILTEYSSNGTSIQNKFRRFWARWDGWTGTNCGDPACGGPQGVIQATYLSQNSMLLENVILVWNGANGSYPDQLKFLMVAGRAVNPNDGYPSGLRLLGSLGYGYPGASLQPQNLFFQAENVGRFTLQDVVAIGSFSNALFEGPLLLVGATAPTPGAIVNRVTTVKSSNGRASSFGSAWTVSGFNENPAAAGLTGRNVFDTGTTEASLCYRYNEGTRQTTPLWPWPMDERIKAALAMAGSKSLVGSAGNGYTANTVTSEVVSKVGAIPAGCGG